MIKKILIANRGEIAVRVIAACKELGITSVAIYSEPDKHGRHVSMADESIQLEGQPAKVYLDGAQIVELAKKVGADAVHPGYGFLSENSEFAKNCADAGIKFIGPEPEVIRRMGSKVESRRAMEVAGVPVVPGTTDPVLTPEEVKTIAAKYGYPVAIKASAGGGGRGLKVVRSEAEVEAALAAAQREGASYFGSAEVYVEKYLDTPRHIEVQVIGDEHGNVIHLGERDCSTQRRHQKLIEETPAANLDPEVRTKLLDAAVRGAASLKYSSAGTLEFLVSGKEFYFLEVNTRVQVEHPITEMVTGVDIVKEQIAVANGAKLSIKQEDVSFRGHSIEFRINAEDPFKNFMPNPGTIRKYSEPRLPWVRVDTACYDGYQILPFYDSLLAKLVIWGRTREEAIARSRSALKDYIIEGVSTTIPFHLAMLDDELFESGKVSTKYVEAEMMKSFMKKAPAPAVATAGAAEKKNSEGQSSGAPVEEDVTRRFDIEVGGKQFKVAVKETTDPAMMEKLMTSHAVAAGAAFASGSVSGAGTSGVVARGGGGRSLGDRQKSAKSAAGGTGGGTQIFSSMNGLVKQLLVKEGDKVAPGQCVIIFEAMKMESEIVATVSGTVASIKSAEGDTVEVNSLLMEIKVD